MKMRILPVFFASVALVGCVTTTPPSMVQQPMTVRPGPAPESYASQGAIYNPGLGRPLFEDRRARFVGDTITINIVEKTSATKNSETKAAHKGSVDSSIPVISGLPFKALQGMTVGASNDTSFDGSGSNTSDNTFSSTLTCTVIEVLPNGNLQVSGEKAMGLKEGEEFVRFSGVVNPAMISAQNTVQSTQVADARLEFKANGFVDSAQVMGWLGRFFLSVLPF